MTERTDPYGEFHSRALGGDDLEATKMLIAGLRYAALHPETWTLALRLYLVTACTEILQNIEKGKPPGADTALLLKRRAKRPKVNADRDMDIELAIAEARTNGVGPKNYLPDLMKRYGLALDSVKDFEKKHRADIDRWERFIRGQNENGE